MSARILVCVTCSRYAPPAAGEPTPGQRLADAMRRSGGAIAIRTVECLNGCPHPCAAALRTPGKTTIRFSGLASDDVPALLEAAARYGESAAGEIALPASLEPRLLDRVSMRVV